MAETSPVEMEPSISTPLLQEAKRKNNEMDSIRRRKKPRKKVYRPKVIGEGRKSKSNDPAKQKQVSPTPNPKQKQKQVTPTPNPKPKTHKNNQFLEPDDDQFNIIVSCKNLVAGENELECEKVIEEVEAIDSCRDLVLAGENEIEEDKSTFIERLDGTFCLPKECKRKKSSRKMLALRSEEGSGSTNKLLPFPFLFRKGKRSPTIRRFNIASLLALPVCNQLPRYIHRHGSKETRRGSTNKLLPFLFMKGKRSPTIRRFNIASLLALPVCNQLPRYIHRHGSKETTNFNGNDIAAFVGSQLKRHRNHPKAQANFNNGSIKIEDACRSPTNLKANGRDDTVAKAITYGKHNGQLTMTWLHIRHFLTNSRLINGRSETNPSEKSLSIPRIITGSEGNLTRSRQQDLILSTTATGSANKLRPTLSMALWNNSERIRNNHEHTRLIGTENSFCGSIKSTNNSFCPANNKVILGEETNFFCKSTDDGRYKGALLRNGTDLACAREKQIIPYVRKKGKKTKKAKHNPNSVDGTQGAIVPHPKSLNSTKKKELSRVYLDPRDVTVWKVLFEDDSEEKVDKGWWENERAVFRGRINAFNAIMHVILGDRRFSPWKGSVVDSVVGVFLTQNVSDHLSSSAYMSLAATFPIPETENHPGEEILCIQQSSQRNEGFCPWESRWNNGSMMENNNAISDPEEAKELNPVDAMYMLKSLEKCCYSCSGCISKSKSGLENNAEGSNHCEEMEVDLPFTPNEKSQIFIGRVGKFQNQEIQPTSDVNAKCCLCSECNEQIKNEIKKTIEICNYYQGKMEVGSQLSGDIGNLPQKLDFDLEKVQSQESVIQASDNTNEGYLEDKNPNHETDISKGQDKKKSKMKQEVDWNSLREKWDSMRKKHCVCEPRNHNHMDSVDWEAVRSAEPIKIADAIKERGQHNIIAGRIKEFLDRTARIHGCIDLEWLRHAPPNDVKEYLLEIDGLGLKSVECIRLLALQQVAFPVDINVGRITVRLGWVPLEPLPEEVQMHLLETFPMMDSIQKYLWPRLSMLDQRTLYELHYQLITFGKVFCTKRKPNCNACPLRADCRHYASAYASARLALPGPPNKGLVSTMAADKSFEGTAQVMNPTSSEFHIDANPFSGARYKTNNCEPIIEEPPSPKPAYDESQLTDIEDLCEYDSDDVPIIRLSFGHFTTLKDDNITGALVPLHTKATSIPMPKLKHIDRLRTEHQAYELPDTHPLLSELERREPNDPCPYLLCIFSPDSSEPPNTRCTYQEIGELCTEGSCSSCNIAREQKNGTVCGTILIPCRTAMRGKFPLNGTYFQVNEVFADDETSKNPIHVPREWIWDLPRRITYFGTSTTTIFRGLAKEDIQYCFKKGFICVRGFNRRTRTPKRLAERLHKATTASIKARANKNEDRKQKTCASNKKSPQEL
ncbi:unnamed protein product [Citrullus colocynthis]|uniref:HhH-GPD domain-containing protein n=1 Tax=Citrullus colocynthis TaxID=252529 RepID=A0ABP0Y5V8_9ROSI